MRSCIGGVSSSPAARIDLYDLSIGFMNFTDAVRVITYRMDCDNPVIMI